MYGQLGDIIFQGLYGPDTFEMSESVSLPQHSHINRRPKQQFTGIDLSVLKIKIGLNNSFIDVEGAIEKFRQYRNSATHLKYITGSGSVIGTFVIQKSKTVYKQTDRSGNIVHAEIEHELIELSYSNPKLDSVTNAIANRQNRPQVYSIPVRPIPSTLATSAALDVVDTRANASVSALLIEEYTIAPEEAESKVDQARSRVAQIKEHMANAAAKVQQAEDVANQAQAYVANMYTVAQKAQTLIDYIDAFDPNDPVGSMENINDANTQMMSSVSVMSTTSQPLAAWTGARR
jgi:phage protein U